jgi:hypothetical protein
MAHVQPESHDFHAHPAPPFSFFSTAQPTPVAETDAPTHRPIRQGALEPGAFEQTGLEAIEVMALWGATILFVRHLSPRENFTIGEGSGLPLIDFEVSAELLGAPSLRLVDAQSGIPQVRVPSAARVRVQRAGEPYAQPSQLSSVALLPGSVVELELGALTFRIANVAAGALTPRAGLRSADGSLLVAFGLSFATAAALLASLAFWMPALGLTDDEELDRDRLVLMKQYLSTQAERNREEEAAKDQSGNEQNEPGAPAQAAQGREGALGKLNAPVKNARASVKGDSPSVELSRAQLLEAAKHYGMIELLGTLSGSAGASSPFARNEALGHDDADFEGNLWGDAPGESGGNGLRLTGLENGGGGHGLGVGMDGVGTCGSGNCGPKGFGKDFGRGLKGDHKPTGPTIHIGATTLSGHLPAEVVQRIVRQNYGRFRMCYENGLRANPNLTGRVTARFVIGSSGSVSAVQNGGSDLPDSGVVSCVVQAFYGLSFPSPENGIVTVSYPILFSPG